MGTLPLLLLLMGTLPHVPLQVDTLLDRVCKKFKDVCRFPLWRRLLRLLDSTQFQFHDLDHTQSPGLLLFPNLFLNVSMFHIQFLSSVWFTDRCQLMFLDLAQFQLRDLTLCKFQCQLMCHNHIP